MPLTPSDVENRLFGRQLRGYSIEEVDAFCDEVEGELRRLLTEVAQPAGGPAPTGAGPVPVPADTAPSDQVQAALRTLQMAERTAGQTVAEAQAEAGALLTSAREEAAATVAAARADAGGTVTAARAEADDVRRQADEHRAQVLADLGERAAALERKVSQLADFEREHRERLAAYLGAQLRELSALDPRAEEPRTDGPQHAAADDLTGDSADDSADLAERGAAS